MSSSRRKKGGDVSETVQQTARSLQGYRIELAPTPEQCIRLAQHAGLARVAENFYLEQVRAVLAQRAAEVSYGVAEAELTGVPWSAPQLEALWRAAHPDRYP
jgi:putative transposase